MTRVFALVVLVALALMPAAALAAPTSPQPAQPLWAVTLNPVTAYSGASEDAVSFGKIPAQTTLQVLDYQGDFAHVLDPRSKTVSYVPSDQLGPGEAPSPYVLMPAPQLTDDF